MIRHAASALLLGALFLGTGARAEIVERPDLKTYFDEAGVEGTIVVQRPAGGATVVYNPERAATGFLPASTFKIVNSLIGLDAGAAKGVDDEVFPWNGEVFLVGGQRILPAACEASITLRVAFANSCVPVYQELARRIGADAFRKRLAEIGYGNADIGGAPVDGFWLHGDLRISAFGQIAMLDALSRNALPFSNRAMDQVRDIMVVERAPDHVLRAKTGMVFDGTSGVGWWVGWVERQDGATLFALNIAMTRPDQAPARMAITRAVLKALGAL